MSCSCERDTNIMRSILVPKGIFGKEMHIKKIKAYKNKRKKAVLSMLAALSSGEENAARNLTEI